MPLLLLGNTMNKDTVIKELQLEPLPLEGGYFRRTYEHSKTDGDPNHPRLLMSSIFYLLTSDSPVTHLHKNRSDTMRYFQLGSPLDIITIRHDGTLETVTLGPNILGGHKLQHVVPGGCWFAARLHPSPDKKDDDGHAKDYGLISEAVSPGFEYSDRTMATDDMIKAECPQHYEQIKEYIYRE